MVSESKRNSYSDDELDNLLLIQVQENWLKVARIVGNVMLDYNVVDENRLISRVKILVEKKKIESAGDLDQPRFSEVRLPIEGIAGQFGQGIYAYSKKNYETAFKIFELLANLGEGGASWRIGEMYAKGLGVKTNTEMAKKWYSQALEQGFLPAQESLKKLKDI